jgi:serine/threonine protein kinase
MLTVTGAPLYRAPEMLEGGSYTQKVDLWGVGLSLFFAASGGIHPFYD